jgi:hypothetical protein
MSTRLYLAADKADKSLWSSVRLCKDPSFCILNSIDGCFIVDEIWKTMKENDRLSYPGEETDRYPATHNDLSWGKIELASWPSEPSASSSAPLAHPHSNDAFYGRTSSMSFLGVVSVTLESRYTVSGIVEFSICQGSVASTPRRCKDSVLVVNINVMYIYMVKRSGKRTHRWESTFFKTASQKSPCAMLMYEPLILLVLFISSVARLKKALRHNSQP